LQVGYFEFHLVLVASYQKQVESKLRKHLGVTASDSFGKAGYAYIAIPVYVFEVAGGEFAVVGDVVGQPAPGSDCFVEPVAGFVGEGCDAEEEEEFLEGGVVLAKEQVLYVVGDVGNQTHLFYEFVEEEGDGIVVDQNCLQHINLNYY
jgi:hypothetical protein